MRLTSFPYRPVELCFHPKKPRSRNSAIKQDLEELLKAGEWILSLLGEPGGLCAPLRRETGSCQYLVTGEAKSIAPRHLKDF
jgi:hypothetical protein